MIDKTDVAEALGRHEELAKAELQMTAAHTNAMTREGKLLLVHRCIGRLTSLSQIEGRLSSQQSRYVRAYVSQLKSHPS